MKKAYLLVVLLTLCASLFAQTDYTFVLEKGSNVTVSVFQTLAAALVLENDTVSVVSYTDNAAFLVPPLLGKEPDFLKLASEKILSDPLKGAVTANGITAAIIMANDQAKAWGRPGVPCKLIIITGVSSAGKAGYISTPEAFSSIYYLSIDAPPEQALASITASTDDNTCFWAIDAKNQVSQNPDLVTLADGIYACVNAIVPTWYKNMQIPPDTISFSPAGKIRNAVVLVQNSSNNSADLLRDNKKIPNLLVFAQPNYTVVQMISEAKGQYEAQNGKIVLVLNKNNTSWFYINLKWLIIAVIVIGLLVFAIIWFISYMKTYKPAWKIEVEGNQSTTMYFLSLKKKRNLAYKKYFSPPITIWALCKGIFGEVPDNQFNSMFRLFGDNEDDYFAKKVSIVWDKKSKDNKDKEWLLKYPNSEAANDFNQESLDSINIKDLVFERGDGYEIIFTKL